jgi:hypothetical protein
MVDHVDEVRRERLSLRLCPARLVAMRRCELVASPSARGRSRPPNTMRHPAIGIW